MIGLVLVTHGRLAVEFRAALGACRRPAEPDRGRDHRARRRRRAAPQGHHRGGQAGRHRRRRRDPHRHVRRHAFQPRDLRDEPAQGRGARRHQSADAGQARQGPRRVPADGSRRGGAGSRPQIRHHRQPRARPANERARRRNDDPAGRAAAAEAPSSASSTSSTRRACTRARRPSSCRRSSASTPTCGSRAAARPSAAPRSWA